jgi:hypothetical protein
VWWAAAVAAQQGRSLRGQRGTARRQLANPEGISPEIPPLLARMSTLSLGESGRSSPRARRRRGGSRQGRACGGLGGPRGRTARRPSAGSPPTRGAGGGGDPRRALMGWDQVRQRGECGDRESPASCARDARGDDDVPRRRGGWSATSGATSAAVQAQRRAAPAHDGVCEHHSADVRRGAHGAHHSHRVVHHHTA